MSTNLHWAPVPETSSTLPYELKKVLQEVHGFPVHIYVSETGLAFFKGAAAAGLKGAQELIDLVEKYGEIRVWEE